jgi:hypothetical protein
VLLDSSKKNKKKKKSDQEDGDGVNGKQFPFVCLFARDYVARETRD